MGKTRYRVAALVAALVLAFVFLTGCGHIEDTNGDDPSLVTISRENMVDKSMSYTSSGVSTTTKRYHVTSNTYYEDIDIDYLKMSNGKISGIKNIMVTELRKGQILAIACETDVTSGNIAVILLSPDGDVLCDFAIGAHEEVTVEADQTGTGIYLIRIGTESFSGVITLTREFSES